MIDPVRWTIALALAAAAPGAVGVASAQQPSAATIAEQRAQCGGKLGWSDPAPPVRIFANVYDVGTCGITVLLIAGDAGAIVIDAATAAAVPSILANIARLGFRPSDVKLLLSSHEHSDHVGGLHDLQRGTGATVVATTAARPALATGVPARDDPQRSGTAPQFRGVTVGRVVRDGEVVTLGSLRLTAHVTPGHAPGSTSWSWRSCEGDGAQGSAGRRGGAACHDIVYADSVSPVSVDGYRFTDHPAYVAQFRRGLAAIGGLRCDLLVTPHPEASGLYERLTGTAPLATRTACADYAAQGRAALAKRLASEAGAR